MRPFLTRLLAGLFTCLTLAGCPTPAPAKPKPVQPITIMWYSWDWNDPAAFSPAAVQAVGCNAVLAVATEHFGPQNRVMSLEELRKNAAQIQARCGPLPVWWGWSTARQAGNPTPTSPTRTLCDPRDQAQRTQLLDNYASIGRVCREFGFPGLALDTENMAGGLTWPDEPGARELGKALAVACRQNSPTLKLAAFGPTAGTSDGFRKVWRGFSDGAKDGIFLTEDTYGASAGIDMRKALQRVGNLTGAKYPSAGWYASTKGADVAGWFRAATPQLQTAAKISPYLMVYRQGTLQPDQADALGRTLHAVQPAP